MGTVPLSRHGWGKARPLGGPAFRRTVVIACLTVLVVVFAIGLAKRLMGERLQEVAVRASQHSILLEVMALFEIADRYEWQLIKSPNEADEILPKINSKLRQVHFKLAQVTSLKGTESTGQSLSRVLRRYENSVMREFALLKSGQVSEAYRLDEEQVDPTSTELMEAVRRAAEQSKHGSERAVAQAQESLLQALDLGLTLGIVGVLALVLTVRRLVRSEERAHIHRAMEWRLNAMLRNASDTLLLLDEDGKVLFASESIEAVSQASASDAVGKTVYDVLPPVVTSRFQEALEEVLSTNGRVILRDLEMDSGEAAPRYVDIVIVNSIGAHDCDGVLVTVRDVTQARDLERRLDALESSDPLTGLPNRERFMNLVSEKMRANAAGCGRWAMMVLDIDRVSVINESLGHRQGDALLCEVVDRLRWCVPTTALFARLAGDEFCVFFPVSEPEKEISTVGQLIFEALKAPILLSGHAVAPSVSIGAASTDRDVDGEALLKRTYAALYEAKAMGSGSVAVWNPQLGNEAAERLEIETELSTALNNGELEVVYQPFVDMADGSVIGAEALLRWNRPSHGVVQPARFIPVAERSGDIVPIGMFILEQACKMARKWSEELARPLHIGVNVSGRQFEEPDFLEQVSRVVDATGVNPSDICLEVTESVMIRDYETMSRSLNQLREIGFHLAVDDFGTGYTSMTWLSQLPFSVLKIDRSFTANLGQSAFSDTLVRGMVALAKALGLSTICEGIETRDQALNMLVMGCDYGQGYLFGKPMGVRQFESLLYEKLAA